MKKIPYDRKECYSIPEVLDYVVSYKDIKNDKSKKYKIYDNDRMKMTSQRLKVFKNTGTYCHKCKLEASFFAKEKTKGKDEGWHFNLYGIKNGEEVLFTRDHVISRSNGGSNDINNQVTMCGPCNWNKGNSQ